MTDMTLAAPLTAPLGFGAGDAARSARGDACGARLAARRREYRAYFALVLIVALPLELANWAFRAVRGAAWPTRGPLRAAWSHAAVVAPIILSA